MCDPKTKTYFLAVTGSAVNIIREQELEQNYPEAFANRTPIKQPLKGIGGEIYVTALTYLPFARRHGSNELGRMSFCTGPEVPLNIIGNEWLAECDDEALNRVRLHPSDVPVFGCTKDAWDVVSLITSLVNPKIAYELAPVVPQSERNALLSDLNQARQKAAAGTNELPQEMDLNDELNTLIPLRNGARSTSLIQQTSKTSNVI